MEYVSTAGFRETMNSLTIFAGEDLEIQEILDKAERELAKLAEKRRAEASEGSTYGVDDY